MSGQLGSELPDAEELGRRLVEVCRLCEEARRAMSPAERDEQLQAFLAQAMGPQGRLEATRRLCEAAMAIRRMQEGGSDGTGGVHGTV